MSTRARLDPTRHNYYPKVLALWNAGAVPRGSVRHVDILHDDSCAVFTGGYCDCDPDVRVGPST